MKRLGLLLLSIPILASPAWTATHLVRPDGTGDFPTIQAAVEAAQHGDVIDLADGTFTGPGNRDVDLLGKRLLIRGQSGDAGLCVLDCQGSEAEPHRGFILQSEESPRTTLKDLTIQGGWAEMRGGGILCMDGASISLVGCVLDSNRAYNGAGLYKSKVCHLTDCIFIGNVAGRSGGAWYGGQSGTVTGCLFKENTAMHGGGIYIRSACHQTITDCRFMGNVSTHTGGAMHIELHCSPLITGCTFVGNTAATNGGAIDISIECWPVIRECTFWGNACPITAGISIGEICDVTLLNVIVAGSTQGKAVSFFESTLTMACCVLHGNAGGDWVDSIEDRLHWYGNMDEDPLFCDPEGGDFHLQLDSPCTAGSIASWGICSRIGAWPAGCGSPPVAEPLEQPPGVVGAPPVR